MVETLTNVCNHTVKKICFVRSRPKIGDRSANKLFAWASFSLTSRDISWRQIPLVYYRIFDVCIPWFEAMYVSAHLNMATSPGTWLCPFLYLHTSHHPRWAPGYLRKLPINPAAGWKHSSLPGIDKNLLYSCGCILDVCCLVSCGPSVNSGAK